MSINVRSVYSRFGFSLALLMLASCTEPGETTGISSAAGGVMGAGLGAIIGSQTGSAGAGIAIGAVAGAATGAAIGNALEAQDKAIRTQDEAIERQEQALAANRRELEELKRSRDSSYAYNRQNSYNSQRSYPRQPSYERSTTLNRPAGPGAYAGSAAPATARGLNSEPRAAMSSVPRGNGSVPPRTAAKAPPAPKFSSQSGAVQERDLTAPAAAGQVDGTGSIGFRSPETEPVTVSEPVRAVPDEIPPLEESAPPAVKSDTGTGALAGAVISGDAPTSECGKASLEIDKANSSREVADRLFHYRRALRLCPDNAGYHNDIGEIYLSLNRTVDAEFEFREALRLNPELTEAKNNLDSIRK